MLPNKIFIADPQVLTREGIKTLLSRRREFEICGEAKDSNELKTRLPVSDPDIIILAHGSSPHFNLHDLTFIRTNFPAKKIILLSAHINKTNVLEVFEFGINGYLLKECEEEELIHAIQSVQKEGKFFCHKILETIVEKKSHQCPLDSICHHCIQIQLSEREKEIIQLIGEGNSTKEISKKLILSFHTISTHRKNIFRKLKIKNSSELILYALKKGIITTPVQ